MRSTVLEQATHTEYQCTHSENGEMEQNENEPDCIVCEKESSLDGILDDRGKGVHRDADNGHCHNGKHSAC